MQLASRPRVLVGALGAVGVVVAATTAVVVSADPGEQRAAPVAGTQAAWRAVPGSVSSAAQISTLAATPDGGMWAVGNLTADRKPLVERLTSQGWARVTLPAAVANIQPNGVSATSASNVWVSGRRSDSGNERVLRWDGASWKAYDLGPSFYAYGVTTLGPQSTWVFGSMTQARHWNGSAWRSVDLGLQARAMSGTSANNVWAVGQRDGKPAAAHWNGTTWTRTALPAVPDVTPGEIASALSDVHVVSATEAWAVGTLRVMSGGKAVPRAMLARWNGSQWTLAFGADGTGYTKIESDGSGGYWFSYGSILRHRSASGTWTQTTVAAPAGKTGSVNSLAHRPGTKTVWAGGVVKPGPGGYNDASYWRND